MNKNIFIKLLALLFILSGCTGDTCIDPDDFGFIKFNVSSRYDASELTSRQLGDEVAPWRDSSYKVNGYPLTIMVRPWSYMLGDRNISGELSAWCPWYGQQNNTTTLSAFCARLQPCQFIDGNMCPTPTPVDAPITNAPCILTNGVGLYFLIAAKNTNPNMSPDSQRNPQGISQHLGEPTTNEGYAFYSVSSTGQFQQAGGINYQYSGVQASDYAQSLLYFKILDKFYDDNSGQYRLVIKSGVSDTRPDPLQFLTDLVKNVLFGTSDQDPGIVRQTYQQIIDTPGYRMSVSALLTLYIMFTGFSFLIGNVNLTHVELITRILKVSVVSILLSTSKAWTFFNDYLFVFFVDGVEQILQIINEASTTGPGSQSLLGLLIAPQTLSKLFSLLFVDPLGFIYIILYLIALYFIFMLIFKATIIYLTALITIGMIITMGPIFICFMLFNITRSLFENWLRQLISYALQPIILFVGIAFISMLIRTEIYSTLGFAVCKRDFPNLGPINQIFGSFTEDLDSSLGNSIFYWWFPVPLKGGINNFHQANILVPEDHIQDDGTFCTAYQCIDNRYIELPFLDLVKDANRISNFINGRFVQLDGLLLIFVSIYLLSKFNDTAISTASFIAGTSGNLTKLQSIGHAAFSPIQNYINRPINYATGIVSKPINRMQEKVSTYFAEKYEGLMIGKLEKEALSSSANRSVQNEVKRKYGIDHKDVNMKAQADYENGIRKLLSYNSFLPKGNELNARELSNMSFEQLRDKIAENKYGVKDYKSLSTEQKAELDKFMKSDVSSTQLRNQITENKYGIKNYDSLNKDQKLEIDKFVNSYTSIVQLQDKAAEDKFGVKNYNSLTREQKLELDKFMESDVSFVQLRNQIAENKYGAKDYSSLSAEQRVELDKLIKSDLGANNKSGKSLRELAIDARFTKDYQEAYINAHQNMSARGVGLLGKNIGLVRTWQEMDNRVKTKRKLKEEKRVAIGEKIYAGYTGLKREALTAVIGKDLRDKYEGNLTSAEWHGVDPNDPQLRTYNEILKDNDKRRKYEELKLQINKETLGTQTDVLSPEYLANLERSGRQSDVEYYQNLSKRKLVHEVQERLSEKTKEDEPVIMGDTFMRNMIDSEPRNNVDSQTRNMIDNARKKHEEIINNDWYGRREKHYDLELEKAQKNIDRIYNEHKEQIYEDLKEHFKKDDIKHEEIPALIARKAREQTILTPKRSIDGRTVNSPTHNERIKEELNDFYANVKNYEYSAEVLHKIEDRKQVITDEVNHQIDRVNKYRENANMQKYDKPVAHEVRTLRKLEDHLRSMK